MEIKLADAVQVFGSRETVAAILGVQLRTLQHYEVISGREAAAVLYESITLFGIAGTVARFPGVDGTPVKWTNYSPLTWLKPGRPRHQMAPKGGCFALFKMRHGLRVQMVWPGRGRHALTDADGQTLAIKWTDVIAFTLLDDVEANGA